jgi:hypothetical protein
MFRGFCAIFFVALVTFSYAAPCWLLEMKRVGHQVVAIFTMSQSAVLIWLVAWMVWGGGSHLQRVFSSGVVIALLVSSLVNFQMIANSPTAGNMTFHFSVGYIFLLILLLAIQRLWWSRGRPGEPGENAEKMAPVSWFRVGLMVLTVFLGVFCLEQSLPNGFLDLRGTFQLVPSLVRMIWNRGDFQPVMVTLSVVVVGAAVLIPVQVSLLSGRIGDYLKRSLWGRLLRRCVVVLLLPLFLVPLAIHLLGYAWAHSTPARGDKHDEGTVWSLAYVSCACAILCCGVLWYQGFGLRLQARWIGLKSLHDIRVKVGHAPHFPVDELLDRLSSTPVTDRDFKVLRHCGNVRSISMRNEYVTGEFLKYWQSEVPLKGLRLYRSYQIQSSKLQRLADIQDLRDLVITHGELRWDLSAEELNPSNEKYELDDAGLTFLTRLKGLRALELGACRVSGKAFSALAGMKDLERITLSGPSFNDEAMVELQKTNRLKRLILVDTSITDTGFRRMGPLASLEYLFLLRPKVTADSFAVIGKCNSLKHLSVSNVPLGGDALHHLVGLDALTTLSLENTRVADEGLQYLSQLPSLREVNLSDCPINNDGLRHLGKVTSLTSLQLFRTLVSDDGLLHLKELQNLKEVSFVLSSATKEGVAELNEHLGLFQMDQSLYTKDW